ncbi:hypothetical protein PtB15_15B343 [Puccinia triticina]|nr:hypothetical protein PtB15_15B343 [Puccinia triticina]
MNRTSQQLSRFSTQIPQAAPKRIAASFKPGPFRGALLASEPRQDHDQQPQHDYSASQLLRAARTTPSSSSASPPATTTLHFPHSRLIRQHLDELLYPLTFSDQLACRIVSSKNLLKSQHALDALEHHAPGGVGFARLGEHNSKLSFIGRRAIEVIEDALLTKFVLGQYVGHQWELEKIMRWRELAPPPTQAPPTKALNGTGLWMARGHVVEAIVGAVMAEHGARLSIAVFHSLVLPHLSFRLDPALLPAIKAVQTHDHELESPAAGLVDWKSLRIEPFLANNPAQQPASAELSTPAPVAAVG